jgi:sigma-B regulation protein RsbU (phosphoserine phosphatase)
MPLLISNGKVTRPRHGNVPIGLLADASFESDFFQMNPGDRFVMVTDGVTEAQTPNEDLFTDERLEACATRGGMEQIFAAVSDFTGGIPLQDDCTVVELTYSGF